jgi:sugar O-acyltransferase (sialic acid O-acetyltransferase NeuD family)
METSRKPIVIIGYSGHAYVVVDIFRLNGRTVNAYCDNEEKSNNPFHLSYMGRETESAEQLKGLDFFPAVGQNEIRKKIFLSLSLLLGEPPNAIHPNAIIAGSAKMGNGVMVAASATINSLAVIGQGVICNTSSSIDHECVIGDFTHIAPGAVICGDVSIGAGSFIGANSVITQGLRIGNNVIIGAGSVIVKDVPDNTKFIGNPGKQVL